MTLKELAVDHRYYCSISRYNSSGSCRSWDCWEDFIDEWREYDIDYNLAFRWDIRQYEEEEQAEMHGARKGDYYMEIFIMKQRLGLFAPQFIRLVQEENVEEIVEWLKPHYEYLREIWQPISKPNKIT